jgi:hypothetical protein
MSVFPEIASVPFGNPVVQQLQFKTLMSGFDDLGREQRKQKWLYPRRLVTLRYNFITKAEVQTLYQFYIARAGAYGAFAFFYPSPRSNDYSYVEEYVGTGDGSETVFSLPALDSGNYILFVDGSSQSDPGDYSFSAASGPDGEDKVTFTSAPSAGERITFTFTGRLKVRARFKDDKLTIQEFHDRLINIGIQLQGLLNDA